MTFEYIDFGINSLMNWHKPFYSCLLIFMMHFCDGKD